MKRLLVLCCALLGGCEVLVQFEPKRDAGGGHGGGLTNAGGGSGGGSGGGDSGGGQGGGCAGMMCGAACVDVRVDDTHCGRCDHPCSAGTRCGGGSCLPTTCSSGACGPGQVCVSDACAQAACVGVLCQAGSVCVNGQCESSSCGGSVCPPGQACIGNQCTDPACIGVVCDGGTCLRGACVGNTCGGAMVDILTDVEHCGRCANPCPVTVASTRRCAGGSCTRTVCSAGTFDFDGLATPGCETTCSGKQCTLGDGGSVTLTNPPVHETESFGAPASGASHGGQVQTSASFTVTSSLGESAPAGPAEQSSSTYKAHGGFHGSLRR